MTDVKGYTRVVVTEAGGSAFEDAELDLTSQSVATGTPPMLVGGLPCSGGVMYLQSAGFDSEPHPAPRTQWVVMLRGVIEIEVTDGSRRRFGPGDLVLCRTRPEPGT